MIIVGIDPDVKLNGVATLDCETKELCLYSLSFFALYDFLNNNHTVKKVYIEAGWKNKVSNWRKGYFKKSGEFVENTEKVNQKIAKDVGSNHEVGRQIEKMCIHLQLEYELIVPHTKKKTPEIFFMLTGIETKNQELIDAGMLIVGRI